MPVPFRRIVPVAKRVPVAVCRQRLESSDLYLRREQEAALTHERAKLVAHWYTSQDFHPRFEATK